MERMKTQNFGGGKDYSYYRGRKLSAVPYAAKSRWAHHQRGLSGWSMMAIIFMIAIYGLVFFQLFPAYVDGWAVKRVVDGLSEDQEVFKQSKKEMHRTIMKRLSSNNVTTVSNEDVKISKKSKKVIIDITYEVRVPLMGNLDGVVSFENRLEADVSE